MVTFEAVLEILLKSSWRIFFGVFVASGAILLFADRFGVKDWAQSQRAHLLGLCLLSGAVLVTYLATTIYGYVSARRQERIDLKIVGGSPMYSHWSIGMNPVDKKPALILMCDINFAHHENTSVIIRQAYLKGTKQVVPMGDIVVEGPYDERTTLCIEVSPVKARPGKNLVGRLVFVDQFNDKHFSKKITFRPNTIPHEMQAHRLQSSPNCVFCNTPVELTDQPEEAQMTAHTNCVWP